MSSISVGGSQTVSIYTKREQIVYGVFENELDSLSHYSTLSILFFSVGSFFLDKVLDLSMKNIDYQNPNFAVSLLFFILGVIIFFKKKGLTSKIKAESKPIETVLQSNVQTKP